MSGLGTSWSSQTAALAPRYFSGKAKSLSFRKKKKINNNNKKLLSKNIDLIRPDLLKICQQYQFLLQNMIPFNHDKIA